MTPYSGICLYYCWEHVFLIASDNTLYMKTLRRDRVKCNGWLIFKCLMTHKFFLQQLKFYWRVSSCWSFFYCFFCIWTSKMGWFGCLPLGQSSSRNSPDHHHRVVSWSPGERRLQAGWDPSEADFFQTGLWGAPGQRLLSGRTEGHLGKWWEETNVDQ